MKTVTILAFLILVMGAHSMAQTPVPDSALTGIYITSIHDIDFKQKEYTVNMWFWTKYKRREIDFATNLEIPQAKSFTRSYFTIDSSNGRYFLMMKLQCVMKDNWKTDNFPFDKETLMMTFENSQFDTSNVVFAVDKSGDLYDQKYTLRGWIIDSCKVRVKSKVYNSTFGYDNPQSTYSSYRVRISVHRDSFGLFWKLFLGMYVSFLIAFACFFIHADNIDSRYGLSVGALFAVIGNKYIVDSSLPETTTFTLVDILHGLTLFFIFIVICCTTHALNLFKRNEINKSKQFDSRSSKIIMVVYILLNAYFIWHAIHAQAYKLPN